MTNLLSWNEFLKYFIENEKYLENPLLETKEFVKYCSKIGVNISANQLKNLEKEKQLLPLAIIDNSYRPELQFEIDGNSTQTITTIDELKKSKIRLSNKVNFKQNLLGYHGDDLINILMECYEKKSLFHPSFFYPKENTGFERYYSTFQIYFFSIIEELEIIKDDKRDEHFLRINTDFEKLLKFSLSIQNIYFPYFKSGAGLTSTSIDYEQYSKLRSKFDLEKELLFLNITKIDICRWYKLLSNKASCLLGGFKYEWAQLFKNISWQRKDSLQGKMRFGIELLQWAIMLKRVLEDNLGYMIYDVDEVKFIPPKEILEIKPENDKKNLPRSHRNKHLYDAQEEKNYYYDRYKRLFYLANDFKLDYLPKVMLFVEGETEEQVLPIVFEKTYGFTPYQFGIEIVNFKGVTKLLSTSNNAKKLRNLIIDLQQEEKQKIISKNKRKQLNQIINDLQNVDIVISNWTSFLSYNLEKWQVIPFFLSDNEGNIKHFLQSETPIHFEGRNYNIPEKWMFLWGTHGENNSFKGKDFEFSNFTSEEISVVLEELLEEKFDQGDIQKVREAGHGIKKIDENIQRNKIRIAKRLFERLFDQYIKTKDKNILKRPIFSAMKKVLEVADLNHLPINRKHELINKNAIRKWLEETLR